MSIEGSMKPGRSSGKFDLIGSILYPGFHSSVYALRTCGPIRLYDDTHSVHRAR